MNLHGNDSASAKITWARFKIDAEKERAMIHHHSVTKRWTSRVETLCGAFQAHHCGFFISVSRGCRAWLRLSILSKQSQSPEIHWATLVSKHDINTDPDPGILHCRRILYSLSHQEQWKNKSKPTWFQLTAITLLLKFSSTYKSLGALAKMQILID